MIRRCAGYGYKPLFPLVDENYPRMLTVPFDPIFDANPVQKRLDIIHVVVLHWLPPAPGLDRENRMKTRYPNMWT